jgi:alpha-L-fucosidase 2
VTTPADADEADLVLSWRDPATRWDEAIPLGNGLIGAMVFGGTETARIQVNDAFVWSGSPDRQVEELRRVTGGGAGPGRLREVRDAIDAGDLRAADKKVKTFEASYSQEFLPFVDLRLSLETGSSIEFQGRHLNLDAGVATEHLQSGGRITRSTYVSYPDRVLCVDIDSEVDLSVVVSLSSPLPETGRVVSSQGLVLGVQLPANGVPLHEDEHPAHSYREPAPGSYDPFAAAAVEVTADGNVAVLPQGIRITGSRHLRVLLSTASRGELWWADADASVTREQITDLARVRGAAASAVRGADLRGKHEADFRRLMSATRVRIGARRGGYWDVAGDLLGKDSELAFRATVTTALGRYLLASSSRPGGPPANLQGIWNADLRPAWSSNYTININTQMNYWPTQVAGLEECFEPFEALVRRLSRQGRDVARQLYGEQGWVAHHNTDLWGWALPVGNGHGSPSWAIWMLGGTWLANQCWDHWEFTADDDYLAQMWPVLQGAVEFCLDWLIDDPSSDTLRTIPSTSPENLFVGPDGQPEALSQSVTADIALITSLLERSLRGMRTLGIDSDLSARITNALHRLPAIEASQDGRIREWQSDVDAHEPRHRHLSPAIGLYPLGLHTPTRSPVQAEAIRRFLDGRGPGAMGWSWAWKIALRARLGDAEVASQLLDEATRPLARDLPDHTPLDGSVYGGLLPNLFSSGPPFQIDGNFGLTAAVIEMLVQSTDGHIRLLPALPAAWSEGSAYGIGARGGLSVDLTWAEGALSRVVVHNHRPAPVTVPVRYGSTTRTVCLDPMAAMEIHGLARETQRA